jgi:hypothetical protein
LTLDPLFAKKIVAILGSSGTPPEFGVQYFTVGLERYLKTLEKEYLDGVVKAGLSAFKLVVGSYGGGKTHFLYAVRDLSWKHNYLVSYLPLNPAECPFDKLELVYKVIVANLAYPQAPSQVAEGQERGIEALLRKWYTDTYHSLSAQNLSGAKRVRALETYAKNLKGLESTSFTNGAKRAFVSLLKEDDETFGKTLLWLKGEGFDLHTYAPLGILERIDKRTAFRMMRSLVQCIRQIGYSGMVFLFDEAERGSSLASSKERRQALDNLRQIVDETSNVRIPGAMFFYAIPDDRQLLEGKEDIYEALRQRLKGVFSTPNPSGVKINLEELGMEPRLFLRELGEKLAGIFELAYGPRIPPGLLRKCIEVMAEKAYEERYADISYRRLFVKAFIEALHRLKEDPNTAISADEATKILRTGLVTLENAVIEDIEQREF